MRIDDMKPGPELDRLIAELLGMEIRTERQDVECLQQSNHEIGSIAQYGSRWILRRRGKESMTWAPSTSWEGMRIVVEEMQRRGYEFRLRLYETIGGEWKYAAEFDGSGEYEMCCRSSASYATVLAAIKALQGEDNPS